MTIQIDSSECCPLRKNAFIDIDCCQREADATRGTLKANNLALGSICTRVRLNCIPHTYLSSRFRTGILPIPFGRTIGDCCSVSTNLG